MTTTNTKTKPGADASAFIAAGFALENIGDGSTAWHKEITGTGWRVRITGSDGTTHNVAGPDDTYLVGVFHDDGECEFEDAKKPGDAADAIAIAERKWQEAARARRSSR